MIHNTQIVADAIARLPQQMQDPTWIALITALVSPIQEWEDAAWQCYTLRFISTGEGVQLDAIGEWIGQPRNGQDDATYKLYLFARIATNHSRGTIPEILQIVKLVVNNPTVTQALTVQGVAAYVLKLSSVAVTDATAAVLVSFLAGATSAGVRALVEYQGDVDTEMLEFPVCTFLTAASLANASTLTVTSTASFPAVGFFMLDSGSGSLAEMVGYTGKTATTFTGVTYYNSSGTLVTGVTAHAIGAVLSQSPTKFYADFDGQGLSDSTAPGTDEGEFTSVLST